MTSTRLARPGSGSVAGRVVLRGGPEAPRGNFGPAAERGYGDEHTLKDEPGAHQVSLYDEDGAELSVGTGVNTVATIYGACHLTD